MLCCLLAVVMVFTTNIYDTYSVEPIDEVMEECEEKAVPDKEIDGIEDELNEDNIGEEKIIEDESDNDSEESDIEDDSEIYDSEEEIDEEEIEEEETEDCDDISQKVIESIPDNLGETNNKSVEDLVNYAASMLGKGVDWDGAYGCQCVDFTAFLLNYLGAGNYIGGSAKDYVSHSIPSGWQYVYGNYQRGDIFVSKVNFPGVNGYWGTNSNGHIGLVVGAGENSSQVSIIHQSGGVVNQTTRYPVEAIQCAIRPDYNHQPRGAIDTIEGGQESIHIAGWAIDDDLPNTPVRVHVYIDGNSATGRCVGNICANGYRSDIGNHAYDTVISGISQGDHEIHVYYCDAAGINDNPEKWNGVVHVFSRDPVGNVDCIYGVPGGIRLKGWALDEDSPTSPIDVHLYMDGEAGKGGSNIAIIRADKTRKDVADALPGTGQNHGFDASITNIAPGTHTFYVYAINSTMNENNPRLNNVDVSVKVLSSNEKVISDGRYHILSGKSLNYGLGSANSSSPKAGDNVYTTSMSSGKLGTYDVKYSGEGYYEIYNGGCAIEVDGDSDAPQANVRLNSRNGSDKQKWSFTSLSNGYWRINSKYDAYRMDMDEKASSYEGANITSSGYRTKDVMNQSWRLLPEGKQTLSNGEYYIVSKGNENYGMTVDGGNLGSYVRVKNNQGKGNIFAVKWLGDEYYEISVNNNPIEVPGASTNMSSQPKLGNRSNTDSQKWVIKDEGNGYYSIYSKCNALCLDVTGGIGDGNVIMLNEALNSNTQKWKFKSVKLNPEYSVPNSLKATCGSLLSSIKLPAGFTWTTSGDTVVKGGSGTSDVSKAVYKAKYTPTDTSKYNIVDNISITIAVEHKSTEIKNKKEPVCYAEGYTGDKCCKVCGAVLEKGEKIDKTEHKPGETVTEKIVPATCTKKGSYDEVVYCKVEACHAQISRKSIETNMTEHPDENDDLVCDVCKQQVYRDGFWIKNISDQNYTGKAIVPDVKVYDGKKLLTLNQDYTQKITNNINAGTANVVITGKGNYAGTESTTFEINKTDISGSGFTADGLTVKATSSAQKPAPGIKWNGTAIAVSKTYTYEYYKDNGSGSPTGEALPSVKDPGKYIIKAQGTGNFCGTRNIPLLVTDTQKLISKVTVKKISDQKYTGSAIMPTLTVTNGKTPMTEGTDYTVTYSNNIAVGKATAVVTGKGDYVGTKSVTFNITGTALSKATVEGITSPEKYTGNDIRFDGRISLYIKATSKTERINLVEGRDYEVSYKNNVKAGTGTVIFTGINGYTGTVKKTFKITAVKTAEDMGRFEVSVLPSDIEYSKGGAKPDVKVTFVNGDGTKATLSQGTDYTVSYSNNTAVNDGSNPAKLPAVKVTLKGSYSGSITRNFKISPKMLSEVKATANDKIFQNKKNSFSSAVTLTDVDGKKLSAGKDYEKTVTYIYANKTTVTCNGTQTTRAAGDIVDVNDIIPVNTSIRAIVMAKAGGNYEGSVAADYRIIRSNISAAKVTVPTQYYTGSNVEPAADILTVTIGKEPLTAGKDFEIVPGSYLNNNKKGTASFVIRGKGNYGGTKKVSFTIKAKTVEWWWKYAWSGWTTAAPPNDALTVETKTEYRYRDKSTTTSNSSTMSGWTLEKSENYWSEYGSWSGWDSIPVYKSDSCDVQTKEDIVTPGYMAQKYYFYKYYKDGEGWYYSYTSRLNRPGVTEEIRREIEINTTSDTRTMIQLTPDDGFERFQCSPPQFYEVEYFYKGESRWVPAVTRTLYNHRDRQYLTRYYFYKWGNWSSWGDTKYTSNTNREVEQRTVYRYKTRV